MGWTETRASVLVVVIITRCLFFPYFQQCFDELFHFRSGLMTTSKVQDFVLDYLVENLDSRCATLRDANLHEQASVIRKEQTTKLGRCAFRPHHFTNKRIDDILH